MKQLLTTKGLVALWDFKEQEGQTRKAVGLAEFPLTEQNGTLPRINEGPLSGYSTLFGNKAFLSLPNAELGKLNIYGKNQGVTVMAWVKWTGEQTGFVGGFGMNTKTAANGSMDCLYRCRIITVAIRSAGIFPLLASPRRLFPTPLITRQVRRRFLPTNGAVWRLRTMARIFGRISMALLKRVSPN